MANTSVKLTFLGTGTSQGVPVIACDCIVCTSSDVRDKRLRTSAMIETKNKVLVIDSGPDFRQQMLREQVQQLDAVLFTHEHKDHVAGLDDVRAFNFLQQKAMPLYADVRVQKALKREFHYAFSETSYPGVPQLELHSITSEPFEIEGIAVVPIEAMHGQLPVKGFRFGDLTYITDASSITRNEMDKIRGSKVLVLNALRQEKHYSHFSFPEAVEVMRELAPEKGYFTHLSHLAGKHETLARDLPEFIHIATDGLQVEV